MTMLRGPSGGGAWKAEMARIRAARTDRAPAQAELLPPKCRCGRCPPFLRRCWSCAVCDRGPFSLEPQAGELHSFTLNVMDPNGKYGIAYHACSPGCAGVIQRMPAPRVQPRVAPPAATPLTSSVGALPFAPATRSWLQRMCEGRGHSPDRVVGDTLDDLAANGMLKTALHQGVAALQVADPARAPRAAAFTEALEIREDTRAVLRDFFIASGVPPERLVAAA